MPSDRVRPWWFSAFIALTGNREHVYQASMLATHTEAVLDPEQICALVGDLLKAHGGMVPEMG